MIICFACSPEVKQALTALVGNGLYGNYQEVIQSAILNLYVLNQDIRSIGAVILERQEPPEPQDKQTGPGASARRAPSLVAYQRTHTLTLSDRSRAPSTASQRSLGIPACFAREGLTQPPQLFAPVDSGVPALQECPDIDRWIWGQMNRLLPGKASCRALAHLQQEHREGLMLDEAATLISDAAVELGRFLAAQDHRHGRWRDEAFSTAFPGIGDDRQKSKRRYASQFVGAMTTSGEMTGLLSGLKLAGLVGQNRISLTDAGWRFALLSNLALDGGDAAGNERLSPEEKALLLEHITRSVPVEALAFRAVLRAILDGATTPETLDQELSRRHASRKLKPSFVATQRSGAISRMADLGLVSRIREGIRVSYEVTSAGMSFLEGQG